MYLRRLEVHGVRVLRSLELEASPGLNVLFGLNGAGKTSVLESVHVLGTGRSFRGRKVEGLIRWGTDSLQICGEVEREGQESVRLGVVRNLNGTARIRVNGADRRGFGASARELPLAVFCPESQGLVVGQPERRRALMDWALFHVEPGYGEGIQRYRRALRQRNLALQSRLGRAEARAWEPELQEESCRLDSWRRAYVEKVTPYVTSFLDRLRGLPLEIVYRRGWALELPLADALEANWGTDSTRGWTSHGPHSADLCLRVEGQLVRDVLSRGEIRTVAAALMLAHVAYLKATTGRPAVILADDVSSELDAVARAWFLAELADLRCQAFLTAVELQLLAIPKTIEQRLFHVEQGQLTSLV